MSVTWPERDLEAAVATMPEDGGGGGGSGGGGGGGRASHQMTELEFQATVRRSRDGKPEYKLMGLPRLDYNIMHYKTKLFIVTSLLIFEGSVAPVIFYYALTFGTDLREGIIFAIITSLFGFISGFEFALRSWRLIQKEDTWRPLGQTQRWRFDFTHQSLGLIYTIMTAILIGGSIPHPPLVRLLAIPMPLFFLQIGLQGSIMGWLSARGAPALVRISSVAKGEPTPPFVLPLIEDVVAVDGDGKQAYRQRLMERWRVSRRFRAMIIGLNWFWAIGSLVFGTGLMVVVWTTPEKVAYGVGWGAPLIFLAVWTFITVVWTRRGLHYEKIGWASEFDAREAKLGPGSAAVSSVREEQSCGSSGGGGGADSPGTRQVAGDTPQNADRGIR